MPKETFKLNRFLSKPLTSLFLKTPLTPNHVTFLSLGFGLVSGLLFSTGRYGECVLGALSLQMAMILDNCDGEIARAKSMFSEFGGWLDVVTDVLVDIFFFTGLIVGLLRQNPDKTVLFFGILALAGSFLNFLVVIAQKVKGFGPAVYNQHNPEGSGRENFLYKIIEALREGDSSWLVFLFALAGQTRLLLLGAGAYMQVLWISAILMNMKWLFGNKK